MPNIISLNNIIPETFLLIDNTGNISVSISNDENIYKSGDYVKLLINSVTLNFLYTNNAWNGPFNIEKCGVGPLHFKVIETNLDKVQFYAKFNEGTENEKINIFVYNACAINSKETSINTGTNNLKFLSDDNASFMLLRTNPKLSGNIKLVVDSNNEMYLDTFKINGELSNKKYRKQKISGKSYYSNDIRNVFKDVTSDSIYAIPSGGNNLRNVQRDINKQYIDIYNYGVRINDDKLYSENFSMLAPLWINKNLPDFFIVFKCNEFTEIPSEYSSTERFNFLLEHGTVVKTFDLRKNTVIGNYLYNHQSEIEQYMASAYIDINDYNYNIWSGISIDNGIISKYTETTYDMLHGNIDNQVALDNYVTNGYERNRILNPYLINFEFLFDDTLEDTANLSFNNYFGLYISNNEYKRLYCIKNNNDVKFYNELYDEIKYESYSDETINLSKRIYNVVIDSDVINDNFIRITDKNKDNYYKLYASLPYKNIMSPNVSYIGSINNKFLTININEPLRPGEHLRILDFNSANGNTIFEVVASKVDKNDNVYDFYENNSQTIVNYYPYEHSDKFLTHYLNIFSGYSENSSAFIDNDGNKLDKHAVIKTQIMQIVESFNNMNDKTFKISSYNDNSISFMTVSSNNMLKFQRITSDIIYNNAQTLEITNDIDKHITYYNNFIFPGSEIKMDKKYVDELKIYLPCGFEVWNNRMTYIVDFIAPSEVNVSNDNTHVYSFNKKYYTDIDKRSIAKSDNNTYINIENFPISYYIFNEIDNTPQLNKNEYDEQTTSIIVSPYNSNECIIYAYDKLSLNNDILNIYSIAQIHYNIAGILPIKDFNFSVLDSSNNINSNKLLNSNSYYINGYNDLTALSKNIKPGESFTLAATNRYYISGVSGTLHIYNNDGTTIEINAPGELPITNGVIINETLNDITINDYYINLDNIVEIDGIEKYSIEDINNYISLNTADSSDIIFKHTTDVPLITPTTCKWCINGTDAIGNKIKLSYANIDASNYNAFNNSSSTLYLDNNLGTFGWGSYKHLSNDIVPYVYNDITDAVYIINNGKIEKKTLKNCIIENEMSILSIFSNNTDISKKISTLYYNEYTNSLESIICGQKIILDNLLDNPEKYNNYTFTVIKSSANPDNKHAEIYIDNNLSFILLMIYTTSYNNSYSLSKEYLVDNNSDKSMSFKFTKCNFDCNLKNIISSDYISCNNFDSDLDDNDSSINLFLSVISKPNKNDILYKNNYSFYIENAMFEPANSGFDISTATIITSVDDNINNRDNMRLYETNNNINEYLLFNQDTSYKNDTSIYIGSELDIYDITNNVKKYTKSSDTIKFDNPSSYKGAFRTYAYYCNPEFIDIINFYVNEDADVINITKRDYIGCNTRVKTVNNIPQLWINKVINNNNYPLLRNRQYGIDVLYNIDITRSALDNDLYRIYELNNNNMNDYQSVSGLRNKNLLNTFFGSIGLVMKDYDAFKISNWTSNQYLKIGVKSNNTSDDPIEKYLIELNITDAANNYILNINNFINHYKNDDLQYIYDYIKSALDKFYVINNKNNISVYKKYCKNITIDNKIVNYDDSMIKVENIKLDVIEKYGKYYANIELPNDNYQYAIVFKLTK